MGIIELFKIGFFAAFWHWSTPILTALIYFCVVIGFALQFILEKKSRKPAVRWAIIGLCICGIIISECACQFITSRNIIGIDFINVEIIYGSIICLLLGAVIARIVSNFRSMQT